MEEPTESCPSRGGPYHGRRACLGRLAHPCGLAIPLVGSVCRLGALLAGGLVASGASGDALRSIGAGKDHGHERCRCAGTRPGDDRPPGGERRRGWSAGRGGGARPGRGGCGEPFRRPEPKRGRGFRHAVLGCIHSEGRGLGRRPCAGGAGRARLRPAGGRGLARVRRPRQGPDHAPARADAHCGRARPAVRHDGRAAVQLGAHVHGARRGQALVGAWQPLRLPRQDLRLPARRDRAASDGPHPVVVAARGGHRPARDRGRGPFRGARGAVGPGCPPAATDRTATPPPEPGSPVDRALPPGIRPDADYANRRDVLTSDIPRRAP
jgi:hypothetical protein